MADYIVPQVLLRQLISEVQDNSVKNQNVLVVGPNYQLFRFNDPDERQKIDVGRYDAAYELSEDEYVKIVDAAGTGIPTSAIYLGSETIHAVDYPSIPANSTPDASYVKLFANSAFIKLCELSSATGDDQVFQVEETVPRTSVFTTIRFGMEIAGGKKARDPMFERDINQGDALYLKYTDKKGNAAVYKTTIISLPKDEDGKFCSVIVDESFPVDAFADEPDTPASYDESNGVWTPATYMLTADEANLAFCAVVDDIEISSKTKVPGRYNWKTVESTEYEDQFGLDFVGARRNGAGLWVDYSNWYSAKELAEMKDGQGKTIANGGQFELLSAELFVQYRALLKSTASDIVSISSNAVVEATLGTLDPDNPLAFGVHMATLNCGNRLVYFCGVPTDDVAGYKAVLDKATLTSDVYMIAPTTRDKEVIQAIKDHVESMSTAQKKLWRISFVCMDVPKEDMIYDKASNPNGEDFVAAFSEPKHSKADPIDPDRRDFRIMTFWEGVEAGGSTADGRPSTFTKCFTQVEAGDKVKVFTGNRRDTWDDTYRYTVYTVYKVLSNNSVLLTDPLDVYDDGPNDQTFANVGDNDPPDGYTDEVLKVELYRVLTFNRQVKYIADQSSQLGTRRMYNVFPAIASNNGVQFGGEFLACAVGGLVSSVLPQQPVTNVAINGVDDIPMVYQTYNRDQLDAIAAGGTFIIMQDRPGSKVYVRHQISTAYTDENLLKAELSITKNLDSIAYYFAEIFGPYIGQFNITPEIIKVIDNVLNTGLTYLESDTAAGLYGPQVLVDGTEILYVRQSAARRDHAEARLHLNLPVPFNFFDLDLEI